MLWVISQDCIIRHPVSPFHNISSCIHAKEPRCLSHPSSGWSVSHTHHGPRTENSLLLGFLHSLLAGSYQGSSVVNSLLAGLQVQIAEPVKCGNSCFALFPFWVRPFTRACWNASLSLLWSLPFFGNFSNFLGNFRTSKSFNTMGNTSTPTMKTRGKLYCSGLDHVCP